MALGSLVAYPSMLEGWLRTYLPFLLPVFKYDELTENEWAERKSSVFQSAQDAMQTREISNHHPLYLQSLNYTRHNAYYANYFVDQVERHFAAHPPPPPPEPISLEDQPLSRLAPLPLPRQQTQIPREVVAAARARARQRFTRSTVAAAAASVSSGPRFPPSPPFQPLHVDIKIQGSHVDFEERPLTELHKPRTQGATPKGSKQASPTSTRRPDTPEPSNSSTKPKTKPSTGAPGKSPTNSVSPPPRRRSVLSKDMVIEDDDDDDDPNEDEEALGLQPLWDAMEDEEALGLQHASVGGSAGSQGKGRKTGGTTRGLPKEDEDDEDWNPSASSKSSRKDKGRQQSSSGEGVRGASKGQGAKDRVSSLGSSTQELIESALLRRGRVTTGPSEAVVPRRRGAKGFPAEVPAPSPLTSQTGGTVAGVKQAGKANGKGRKDKPKTASPRGQVTQPDTSFLQSESQAVPSQALAQLPQDKEQDVIMGGSEESGSGEEKQSLQLSMLTRAGGTYTSLAGDTTGTGVGLASTLRSAGGLLDSPSASPLKVPPFLGLTVDTSMAVGLGSESLKRPLLSSDGGGSSASPILAEKEKDNEGEHAEKKVKPLSDPSQFGPSSSLSNLGQSGNLADAARGDPEERAKQHERLVGRRAPPRT
uniref:Uncharacterized protein n=1 Tax=Chromera velia CCMP2878 TaxID=1169474 RepID=A0A0G4HCV7_9ALVE|eukprot:Cvel_26278.t1-p1 / transcript=Cvel_26278.t1 / gene=Cvel_26278 / organism=Chromera_velia_CCMP2878 / gene_product=hypothetical protein / transcript_product=hypothetical protein / location=Cvel_scaffold3102:12326-16751(+) / protein_length=647 / sequence_SO=supercontig / SO=protein_coding / is_pseudo=false